MPEPTSEHRRAASESGFLGRVTGISGATAEYLKARLQLAGIESLEAAIHFGIIAGLAAVALIVVFFGWIFLVMAIIFTFTWFFEARHLWIWFTFGVALLHFGGAVACLFIAKGRLSRPVFTASIDEFKKDQQWLSEPIPANLR